MNPAIRKSASAAPTNFRIEYFAITNLLAKLRDAARTGQDASRLSRYNKLLVPISETASGPGSPSGQPAWGGGCDRIIFHLSFDIFHSRIQVGSATKRSLKNT